MKGIFLLFIFFSLSISGNYAIDFGSYLVKSSFTQFNEVPKIILNSQSKRSTPTFVAFHAKPEFDISNTSPLTEDETSLLTPEIGEKALSILRFKPKLGSGFFPSLVGLDDEELNEMCRSLFVNPAPARLSPNDLVPLFLKSYLEMISTHKPIKNLSLIFPASYLMSQRALFEESLNMIGYNSSKLNITYMDDVDSIIYIYSIEKSFKFKNKPKNILFLDVGASSIKGYVVNFQNKKVNKENQVITTRLTYVIDHKNGGAFVTGLIAQNIKEKLQTSQTSESEDRRIFEAAEKVKIELSKSNSSVIIVQDINGRDFSYSLSRAELESEILMSNIAQAVIDISKEATKNIEIDDIELIGGSSRIPIIEKALKIVYKHLPKISHSLNPDEAVSIGGSYYLQHLMNISKFRKVSIVDNSTLYSIDMHVNDETFSLCRKNDGCIESLNITSDIETINVVYSQETELQAGLAANSLFYDLEADKGGIFTFRFSSHPFMITDLVRCNENKCRPSYCLLLNPPPIMSDVVILFIDPQIKKERMISAQKEVLEFAKTILDEIYKNATIRYFTNHSQRLEIIKCIENEKTSESVSMKSISSRISNMKKCIQPVYKRIEENTTYVYAMQDTFLSLQAAAKILYEVKILKPSGLDKEAKISLKNKFRKTEKWFNESIEILKESPPYLEKPISAKEFKEKAAELSVETERFKKELEKLNSRENSASFKSSKNSKLSYEKAELQLRNEINKLRKNKVKFFYGPSKHFINYDDEVNDL